jgi:phosphoribosylamine-glycine ligase
MIFFYSAGGREHDGPGKIAQSPVATNCYSARQCRHATMRHQHFYQINDFSAVNAFVLMKNRHAGSGSEEPMGKGIYDFFQQNHTWKGMVVGHLPPPHNWKQ